MSQIVVNDRAQAQRQVGQDMRAGDDFQHGQLRDGRQRMVEQLQRGGARPRPLDGQVFQEVADEFADARRAVDMRNDLQQVIGRGQRRQDRVVRKRSVLVAHRAEATGTGP